VGVTLHSEGPSADDAGFTLVELMAALTILAVGVVGAIGVMSSSMRVAGTTGARSKGVAVATQQVETLRAIPYDQLVPAASDDSFTTVEQSIGNRVYTVKWVVTLEDEATPGQAGTKITDAYKKAFVWVSWTDETGAHDVHQTALIYPGGRGKHGTSAGVAYSTNTNPSEPPQSLSATPVADSTKVDLAWAPPPPSATAPPPSSWLVQYSQDATFPAGAVHEVPDALPASVTELRISELAASTTYHFRVFSISANGVRSTTAATKLDVTTGASPSADCSVRTASVTPSGVNKKSGKDGSGLSANPRVAVSTLGSCSAVAFRMEYSSGDGITHDTDMVVDGSGTYSAVLDGSLEWTVGQHEIKIFSYSGGAQSSRATLRLTVCAVSVKSCR